MKTSFWYRNEEKKPDKSGYYLAYRGWGIGGKGDGDCDHGYLYYHEKYKTWYEYEGSWNSSFPDTVSFVYYWTDADPAGWVDSGPPSSRIQKLNDDTPAVRAAWDDVLKAIANYELLKNLSQ